MPDPTLQATALRYAAGDLNPEEVSAFEARLAEDQDARDALAEAVRLSAQAIGQKPPAPHPAARAAIRARLALRLARGQQLAYAALGATAVAACTLIGLALAERTEAESPDAAPATAATTHHVAEPAPAVTPPKEAAAPAVSTHPTDTTRSVAEIWADLSTPDHVERARDDELRWRQRVRELNHPQHVSATVKAAGMSDVREP